MFQWFFFFTSTPRSKMYTKSIRVERKQHLKIRKCAHCLEHGDHVILLNSSSLLKNPLCSIAITYCALLIAHLFPFLVQLNWATVSYFSIFITLLLLLLLSVNPLFWVVCDIHKFVSFWCCELLFFLKHFPSIVWYLLKCEELLSFQR